MVTTANREEAEKISRNLLRQKLIACANIIGPISSSHWWAGKIQRSEEQILLMKSRMDLFENVEKKIKSLHSYEVPEIIAVQIVEGSKRYLEWIDSVLGKVL